MLNRSKNIAIDFAEWAMETVIEKVADAYIIRNPDGKIAVYNIEELYDIYLSEVGNLI